MSENKKTFYAFLILSTGLFILRLPTLFELPGIDQTFFAYFGQKMREGQLLYRNLWDHKPPGIHFFYCGISHLGNGYPWIIPLADTLYILMTMGAILLLAKSFWGLRPALGAAFIFILFSLSPNYQGSWSRIQAENLINLPLVICFYFGYQAFRQQKYLLWFLSGLALGITFIIKFTVLFLALPLIPLLGTQPPTANPTKHRRFNNFFFLALGGMIPVALTILYLCLKKVLPEAYEALIIYNQIYSSLRLENKFLFSFILPQQFRGQMFFTLAVFLLGVTGLWRERLYRTIQGQILLLWILGGILSFYIQGKFFWYHFLSLVPPLSLLGGFPLEWIRMKRKDKTSLLLPLLILILFITATGDASRAYLRLYRPGFASLFERADYQQAIRSLPANTNKIELWEWGKFIVQNTQEKDYIYVWGFAPEIYYYSGRLAPNRFIHHYYLLDAQNPLAQKFPGLNERRQELLNALKEKPVKFFIVDLTSTNLFTPATALNQLVNFSELNQLVKNNYIPLARSDGFLVLKRKQNES